MNANVKTLKNILATEMAKMDYYKTIAPRQREQIKEIADRIRKASGLAVELEVDDENMPQALELANRFTVFDFSENPVEDGVFVGTDEDIHAESLAEIDVVMAEAPKAYAIMAILMAETLLEWKHKDAA